MTPEGLLASAAINIGLAMAVLCIFSILKKQPSNSFIYYARRLSHQQQPLSFDRFSFRRLLPSVSWIPRALRVSEDDILTNSGLDALIIIRLFKFGIRFFVVCSVIGLLILLPLNYYSESSQSNHSHYMNSFTISNIQAGSNRLWVHFSCLWLISLYGLYMLYKEYKEILAKRILWLQKLKDRPDHFTVLVREIPLCPEHKSYGCSVHHFFTRHYQHAFQSHQMLYDGRDLVLLQEQAALIQRKIQWLREKSMRRKSNQNDSLSEPLRGDASKITFLEEKLCRICGAISGMQYETMLQKMELPAAFVTFKSRVGAALAAQSQQHPHPFLWITEEAPEPRDLLWKNLSTPSRRLLLYKIGFYLAATLLTIFFAVPVAAVQGIAKFERLMKWFPPAMAVQLIPGLRSVVTGYLPSVILNGFIYVVPYSILGMAHLAGYPSKSQTEMKVCNMVFYFLVGNVFFLTLLSGSLLDELGESFSHPGDFPSRLARAVTAQVRLSNQFIMPTFLWNFVICFSFDFDTT
ncbi:CSC1-like protein At3g54510 [Chenopodium quinoa]|uniref:CSC1-like protein At3g54510 n=1 Tax=Chenopodium quinoa TaxID=63459 RepID=UPI000B77B8F4|nr:CSC1-like protein At3g54510 [Chenopodium quinoa]